MEHFALAFWIVTHASALLSRFQPLILAAIGAVMVLVSYAVRRRADVQTGAEQINKRVLASPAFFNGSTVYAPHSTSSVPESLHHLSAHMPDEIRAA